MIRRIMAAIGADVGRMLGMRRWVAIAGALSFVMVAVAEDVGGLGIGRPFDVNALDVPLSAINNYAIVSFVLLPLSAFSVADLLVDDRLTGYVRLTGPRLSRTAWWTAKIGALGICSVLIALLSAILGVIVGVAMIDAEVLQLSEYGAAYPDPFGSAAESSKFFGPPPLPAVPLLGVVLEYLWYGIVSWGILTACAVVAAFVPRPWVLPAMVLTTTLFFSAVPVTNALHPLIHLYWDAHTFSASSSAVTWMSSALMVAMQLGVGGIVGTFAVRRADLVVNK